MILLLTGVIVGTACQPVGLTGGIATGKSTVSSLLSSRDDETDFVIIDVDGIAHDILLPEKLGGDSVYHRLVMEFGPGILEESDKEKTTPSIDRRKLGDIVFRDRQARKKLNSITHPKIIKIMLRRLLVEGLNLNQGAAKRRVVCADIPLLFEGGILMRLLFGTIIVVTCKPELQLERLHKRNSDLTMEQCRQRIASQIPVEEKARRAHKVIRNDGDLEELKSQVLRVKEEVARAVIGEQRGLELSWLVLCCVVVRWLWLCGIP
jgi:dephospho-CoA kinase